MQLVLFRQFCYLGVKFLQQRYPILLTAKKIKQIADYICERVVYKSKDVAGINKVFTGTPPVNAVCGIYADAFVYLCQRA